MKRKLVLTAMMVVFIATGTTAQAEKSVAITDTRYDVAMKLQRGLSNTPLRGLGFLLERVGWKTGVNPAFIAAASGTESSFGAIPCCGSRFNIWGWYSMPSVSSWQQAFFAYAHFIRSRWPSARTPWDLNGYCGCGTTAWGNRTSSFMARLGFGPSVIYSVRGR